MNKLKHILLSLLLLLMMQPVSAQQEQGIHFFKGTFEDALKEAQRQNKPLFVDFYATWCVPCKKMEKTVFTQPEVGAYFNERFISLQLDAEKPENVETAKKYKVEAFPTLGIIASDGKAISINAGFVQAAELIEFAKTALGEMKGFEQYWEDHRKSPQDLGIQQELLIQAPRFLTTQESP